MASIKRTAIRTAIAVMLGGLNCSVTAQAQSHWVGSWVCAPVKEPAKVAGDVPKDDITVRDVVHLSIGGSVMRVRISNEFGSGALKVGSVHVAASGIVNPAGGGQPKERGAAADPSELATGADTTKPGTDHVALFGGAASVTIPEGKFVWSDPIKMDAPAFSSLAISVYIPKQSGVAPTIHATALSTNYIAPGDQTAAASLTKATKLKSWLFVTGIDVDAPKDARAVVTLGDSITDGMISTVDANRRWPDDLARRLAADPKTKDVSVLNEGISGGRILWPQAGESMLVRFDRDVLGQTGIKYLIIYAGINDINHGANRPQPDQPESADDLIAGLKKMIDKAHAKGIKVFGATITPEGESKFDKPGGEEVRAKVNAWIRTGGAYDGVFDFDKAVRDPAHPLNLDPRYGGEASGFIHMYDAGYQAAADSIDLSKFQ